MGVPAWLSTVRSHRPAHAVNALGRRSDLLLLNPRDLRREAGGPLVRAEVAWGVLLPGLLRAARDAGAILGLVKPGAERGEGPAPTAFAQTVFRVADEVGFAHPFFLASTPLRLDPADAQGERLRAEVQRYLDAGFTEIIVHAEGWDPSAAAPALRTALEAARERDVAIGLWSATESGALRVQGAVTGEGLAVDLVAVGTSLEVERVAQAIDLLRPSRLELVLGSETLEGLGGLDVSPVVRALMQERLGTGSFSEQEDAPAEQRERLEALLYADLLSVLHLPQLRGTSARVLRALSTRQDQ